MKDFIANVNIITPSCLRVDKATIFFMSSSIKAVKPEISNVTLLIINKRVWVVLKISIGQRIKIYTPAVTRVEEWTKDETGVGAAMAAGNHAEKGNWALFVHAAKINNTQKLNSKLTTLNLKYS